LRFLDGPRRKRDAVDKKAKGKLEKSKQRSPSAHAPTDITSLWQSASWLDSDGWLYATETGAYRTGPASNPLLVIVLAIVWQWGWLDLVDTEARAATTLEAENRT
jgi:hypothetical protein